MGMPYVFGNNRKKQYVYSILLNERVAFSEKEYMIMDKLIIPAGLANDDEVSAEHAEAFCYTFQRGWNINMKPLTSKHQGKPFYR